MFFYFIGLIIKNFLIIVFFDTLLEKKELRYTLFFYLYFLCVTISFGILLTVINNSTFIKSLFSASIVLTFLFFYSDRFAYKIIYFIIVIVLVVCSEIVSGLIMLYINQDFVSDEFNLFVLATQILITSLILFLSITIIRAIQKKIFLINKNSLLTFYPLTSVIVIYAFYIIGLSDTSETQNYILLFCIAILLAISNIIIVYMLKTIVNTELNNQRIEFLDNYLSEFKQHQGVLIQLYKNTKKIHHDLKASYSHLLGLITAKKYEECQKLLVEMTNMSQSFDLIVNTGFDGLDAVLSSKFAIANEKEIKILSTIAIPEKNKLSISEFDISLICANLLDNAIEAYSFSSCDDFCIYFKITYDSVLSSLIIACKNPTDLIQLNQKTSKKDKLNHGFGLDNVKSISQKWHGLFNCYINDGFFNIIVSLNNSKFH